MSRHYTWEVEKLVRIVTGLAELAELIGPTVPAVTVDEYGRPNSQEALQQNKVFDALFNATRLLAYSLDVEWDISDCRDIISSGRSGKDRVLQQYGFALEQLRFLMPSFDMPIAPQPLEWFSNISIGMTFEDFNLQRPLLTPLHWKGKLIDVEDQRTSLIDAYSTVRAYREDSTKWLDIVGPVGAGKTHLAMALCQEMVKDGKQVIALSAPSFQRRYYSTSDAKWLAEKPQLTGVAVLLVDDMDIGDGLIWNVHFAEVLSERMYNYKATMLVGASIDDPLLQPFRDVLVEVVVLAGSYRRLGKEGDLGT